jgi:hypothetical protein
MHNLRKSLSSIRSSGFFARQFQFTTHGPEPSLIAGALSLMPHEELANYVYVYEAFAAFMEAAAAFTTQIAVAGAIATIVKRQSFGAGH